jgi:hypothetical protein
MKVLMTFILMNVPMIVFDYLSFDFFVNDVSAISSVWRVLIVIHILLIPVVNWYFMLAASTDPGIIPARTWNSVKGERAMRYTKIDSN